MTPPVEEGIASGIEIARHLADAISPQAARPSAFYVVAAVVCLKKSAFLRHAEDGIREDSCDYALTSEGG